MTKKRFKLVNPNNSFKNMNIGISDDGRILTLNRTIEILNSFQELSIEDLERIEKLEKENEQLKSEIKDLNDVLARYEEKELQE